MSIRDIGPLPGADEGLNHQIVDTFATIAHSDYAWTEKIWVSIAKADGSIQAEPRPRQVPEPRCDRRLRRRVAGTGAVDRPRQPGAAVGARSDRDRTDRLRDRRSARRGARPARTERRPADLVRSRAARRDAAVLRGAQPRPQPEDEPDRRRRDPLPPGRMGDRHDHRRRRAVRADGRGRVRLPRPLVGHPSGRRRRPDRPAVAAGDRALARAPAGDDEVDARVLPSARRHVLRDRRCSSPAARGTTRRRTSTTPTAARTASVPRNRACSTTRAPASCAAASCTW